ncbi:MAG: hypothetical protein ABIG92_05045 [Candidatus Omnitrophota bacterium]
MLKQKFSKGEAIRFGWKTMKANLWFFVGLIALVIAINIIINLVGLPLQIQKTPEQITAGLVFFALFILIVRLITQAFIELGITRVTLKLSDGKKAFFSDILSRVSSVFNFLLATLAYTLAIAIGIALLIIPGIIVAVRCQFFGFFIVEENAGPIESLKKSWGLTKGSTWNIILFNLLCALIDIAGILCLLIGAFAAIPTTRIARAFVFRRLESHKEISQGS